MFLGVVMESVSEVKQGSFSLFLFSLLFLSFFIFYFFVSGWIQHVAFKNFTCDHTRHAVRFIIVIVIITVVVAKL